MYQPLSPVFVFLDPLLPLSLQPLFLLLLLLAVIVVPVEQADGHSPAVTGKKANTQEGKEGEKDLLALVCPFADNPHHPLALVLLPDLLGVFVEGWGQPLVHDEW